MGKTERLKERKNEDRKGIITETKRKTIYKTK
jgi:hypothetical protein